MSNLTPITREEALLDGEDLEPITRKEQFIRRIWEPTQPIPEPITREEYFLKKAGDGTSPVQVESLSVTENGEYSEQGIAYSPVTVNVPLGTKSITANGTYNASSDELAGYSSVSVNVRTDFYGMIIHQDIANPDERIEYIGINTNYRKMTPDFTTGAVDYGGWIGMPTIVDNKPAMIKTDGTFDYYLDPSDYTKKLDGTASDVANTSYDGNAFAWFPAMWMKITEDGDDLEVRFAYEQLDSDYYEVCPTGSSGVWLPMFYGCAINGHMRSIANTTVLGNTTGNTTTDVQNTSIKANGNDYYFLGGKVLDCITLLQMMWFKTTNSDNICRGNQDGYDTSAADGRYGTKSNPIVDGGQFYLTNDGKSANKVLHCIPLGTYDVWLRNPYLICDNGTYKVSKDYSFDSTGASYVNTGKTSPSAGYQKELTYVDGFGLVPKTVGGGTSTYYADYYWINTSIVAVALSFGNCVYGRVAGLCDLRCGGSAGVSDWDYGCALFLKQSR